MKKKLGKKLALNRETIRNLTNQHLAEAAGGTVVIKTLKTTCIDSISDPGCICATNPGDWTC